MGTENKQEENLDSSDILSEEKENSLVSKSGFMLTISFYAQESKEVFVFMSDISLHKKIKEIFSLHYPENINGMNLTDNFMICQKIENLCVGSDGFLDEDLESKMLSDMDMFNREDSLLWLFNNLTIDELINEDFFFSFLHKENINIDISLVDVYQ